MVRIVEEKSGVAAMTDAAPVKKVVGIYDEGVLFVKKCKKPTREEYSKIVMATGVGFAVVGLCGYVIKYLGIPLKKALGY